MTRRRGVSGGTDHERAEDPEGQAPVDLLQLWISGLGNTTATTPEAEAGPDDESEDGSQDASRDGSSAEALVGDEGGWHDEVEAEWAPVADAGDQSDEAAGAEATAEPEPAVAEDRSAEEPEPAAADAEGQAGDQVAAPPLTAQETATRQGGSWASFGAVHTAEDVLNRFETARPWHDEGALPLAEAASQDLAKGADQDPPSAAQAAPEHEPGDQTHGDQPTGDLADEAAIPAADPSDTARWTLDDLEDYARTHDEHGDDVQQAPEPKHGMRGLLSRIGLTRDHSEEPDVPPTPAAPAAEEQAKPADDLAQLWPEGGTDWAEPEDAPVSYEDRWGTTQAWRRDEMAEPPPVAPEAPVAAETPAATDEADQHEAIEESESSAVAEPPASSTAPVSVITWGDDGPDASGSVDRPDHPTPEAEETQYFDWVIEDDVAPSPISEETSEAAPQPAEPEDRAAAGVAEVAQDHQEWFDDHGLRWNSDDGGYTWFADDGQGWNAETGEPIDDPEAAAAVLARVAPAPATQPAPEPTPEPDGRAADTEPDASRPASDDTDPDLLRSEPTPAPEDHGGGWPEPGARDAPAVAQDADADDLWPTTTGPVDLASLRRRGDSPTEDDADGSASAGSTTPAGLDDDEPDIPPYVEYKPRGAHRPLLAVLFVLAAVLAVIAIFWAVSKGSQAATGIATGVTGFALAFWWGLLSWTPVVVSLDGSVLEVSRGSEGERFELTSPKLDIDVDDDTGSRNWRTTITRPNGTELVIPASAVDPDEFTAIVQHYRRSIPAAEQKH